MECPGIFRNWRNHIAPQHNTLKHVGSGLSLALAASIALSACTEESKPIETVSTTVTVPAPEASVTPTESPYDKKLREQQANETAIFEYVSGSERNDKIAKAVESMGKDIIKNGQNAVGYFDFYNTDTGKWKFENNQGWGWYQHNPQYGGKKEQVSVGAYQMKSGKIDPKKGIMSLYVEVPNTPYTVEFTSPDHAHTLLDDKFDKEEGWDVVILDTRELAKKKNDYNKNDYNKLYEQVNGSRYQLGSVGSVDDARLIDRKALGMAQKALRDLGISK